MLYYILNMECLHRIHSIKTHIPILSDLETSKNPLLLQLIYLTGGHWEITFGDERYEVAPDSLLLVPPQCHYTLTLLRGEPAALHLRFLPAPFGVEENRLCNEEDFLADTRYFALESTFERLVHLPLYVEPAIACRYRSMFEQIVTDQLRPSPGTNLLATTELHTLLARISADHVAFSREREKTLAGGTALIRSVCDYLNTHYARHITLQELSEAFHLSSNYLCTLFRKTTGYSILGYLTARRLEIAVIYLIKTDYRVQDIARAVGIPDEFYFSRLFKRQLGLSPTEYRAQSRHINPPQ